MNLSIERVNHILGAGQDGTVFRTTSATAIKAFDNESNYKREKACYFRLAEERVTRIGQFSLPTLIDCCDTLLVMQLSIVKPPFILDFGKAYLDRAPDYARDPVTMKDWHDQFAEIWQARWPEVEALVASLKGYGIFYYDLKVGNILFGEEFDD